jgi:hypothetical protein
MEQSLALLALVVVPLAQVPLVAYLARYVELDAGETLPAPDRGYVTYGTESARPPTADLDVCPHCGADADPAFDYCGECAGRLGDPWRDQ